MDTLAISEELMAAGIPEPQAKAIAKTQVASAREAAKESSESLATKADLAKLKADMMPLPRLTCPQVRRITPDTPVHRCVKLSQCVLY